MLTREEYRLALFLAHRLSACAADAAPTAQRSAGSVQPMNGKLVALREFCAHARARQLG
jgi:hypothetical protein